MRLRLSFTRHRPSSLSEPGRFENAFKTGAFSKRYGFIGRVNGETASLSKRLFWREIGWLARGKYGQPRTESSALLHHHNFDLWFNFAFSALIYSTLYKPRGIS